MEVGPEAVAHEEVDGGDGGSSLHRTLHIHWQSLECKKFRELSANVISLLTHLRDNVKSMNHNFSYLL